LASSGWKGLSKKSASPSTKIQSSRVNLSFHS
jgi:hypothetical protein